MSANYLSLGRFSIPADTIAAFAALFISTLLYKFIAKERIGDWYWNSFMLYILVYKLSYILTSFSLFLDNPMSVLYFNGGIWGQILAAICVAAYLLISYKNQRIPLESFSIYLLFFIIYESVLHSLVQNFFASFMEFLFLLWVLFSKYKKSITIQWFLFFLLIETLLLSFFHELQLIRNLSFLFWGLFVLAIIKRRHRET